MGKALALLALALPLWEWGSCWGLGPGPGDLEKSPRSDPGPWEVLHRPRRSWVWNQFFVLEEYTGNEPLYVGKVSDTPPLTGSAAQRQNLPRTCGGWLKSTNRSRSSGCPAPLAALPRHWPIWLFSGVKVERQEAKRKSSPAANHELFFDRSFGLTRSDGADVNATSGFGRR